jgi:hypothetical protein
MKSVALLVVFGFLLSACSYTDLIPAAPSPLPPAPTATATVYVTPTSTPTITPTQPTPTFTFTPTLIYLNGQPAPSLTPSAEPTLWVATGVVTLSPTIPPQPLLGNGPFSSILVPGPKLFWGACEPSSIKATVKVADGVPAHTVLIFLRLQDTNSPDTTQWGGGAIMDRQDNGVFTYDLTAKSFEHYHDYLKAWGQYQFVALDSHLQRIGASNQYLNNLTIEPCP